MSVTGAHSARPSGVLLKRTIATGILLVHAVILALRLMQVAGSDKALTMGTALNIVAFVPVLAMLPALRSDDERRFVPAAILMATGHTLACAVWLTVPLGEIRGHSFWLSSIAGIAGVALVSVGVVRAGSFTIVLHAALVELVLMRLGRTDNAVDVVVRVLASCLLFGAYAAVIRRFVQQRLALDAATDELMVQHLAREEREARSRAEEQLDRFTHDEVLSTLSFAARNLTGPHLTDAARRITRRLRAGTATSEPTSASGLHDVLACSAPPLGVGVAPFAGPDVRFPAEVGRQLAGAALEAIRNALRHSRGRCDVVVRSDDAEVTVVVSDDGCGFDAGEVRPQSYGLQNSVVRAVESVGGSVVIDSAPARGTVITLAWRGGGSLDDDQPFEFGASVAALLMPAQAFEGVASVVTRSYPLLGALVVLTRAEDYRRWWPMLAAVALSALVSRRVTRWPGEGKPRAVLWVIASCQGAVLLSLVSVPFPLPETLLIWPLGLAVMISSLLTSVGLAGWGVCLAASTVAMAAVPLAMAGQWVTLLDVLIMLTQPALGLFLHRRTVRVRERLRAAIDAEWARAADDVRRLADTCERRLVWARVRSTVGPVLAALERGEALDPALRERARLGELLLRDWIRARGLMSEGLSELARRWRAAGVSVEMLDDRGEGLTPDQRQAVVARLEEILPHVEAGDTVAVRLLPPDRPALLSVTLRHGDEGDSWALGAEDLAV